ncbi:MULTISPECIES: hypothetical protein [unclassified Streptomyces]|uniref:hypothetical protein n=1 Tax=unclassified Streptomyces TaxID=2593676 RepID=UPI002E0E0CB5|nr:hypothetical protein OG452_05545 [Streptomyces sp. NBC_01197]WSS52469.1 hypothetical protein OG708_29860 [Streptomyces sp. NBC_01180]
MGKPEFAAKSDATCDGPYVMKKLPEVTLAFWITKITATTLGETAGDLFSQTLRMGYFLTTVALFMPFVATLIVQLRSPRYNPVFYWTVILSTSMAGPHKRTIAWDTQLAQGCPGGTASGGGRARRA